MGKRYEVDAVRVGPDWMGRVYEGPYRELIKEVAAVDEADAWRKAKKARDRLIDKGRQLSIPGLLVLAVLLIVGCDQEGPPTCADWLVCYEECRAAGLSDPLGLEACLGACPGTYLENPAFGVSEVKWQDDLLELELEEADIGGVSEAWRAGIHARGECLAWSD